MSRFTSQPLDVFLPCAQPVTITQSDCTVYSINGVLCFTVYPQHLGFNVVCVQVMDWSPSNLEMKKQKLSFSVFFCFMDQVLFTVLVKETDDSCKMLVCGSDRETSNQTGNRPQNKISFL
ncbi:hypothetical protein CRENBAI_010618 [Crenichthys baileyi]|uniref:Uncharacterized protein n=1 Tax=Crenichthys baileyi TaxID=28760 RepID=A0AAV9SF27_9TELE